jgi:hypothetical protein
MEEKQERLRIGLCAACRFTRRITSDRGSIFHQCQLSATDPEFPKYPRLPVLRCAGYDPLPAEEQDLER